RTGSVFTGFESSDGRNWTQVGSVFISMSPDVTVGLAVTAGDNGRVTSAGFDHVAVTTQATFGDEAIDAGGGSAGAFVADTDFTPAPGNTNTVGNSIDTSGVS